MLLAANRSPVRTLACLYEALRGLRPYLAKASRPFHQWRAAWPNSSGMNSQAAPPTVFCALVVIGLVYLTFAQAWASSPGFPHRDSGIAAAHLVAPISDRQTPDEAAPTRACITTGACWEALPGLASVAPAVSLGAQHDPMLSIDAYPEWDLTPPDRPPRRSC